MKSTSKLSIKLLSKNSSDNLASCSNWELIKEMCVKSAILDHSKMTYFLCHTSPVSNVTTEDSYMLNTGQDFWLANCKLESVMVNTTQFTYSPVLSHSHPSTQVKVARGINKHNIKPWMKICLRRLQEQQNKEIVFYCWWRLHASSTLRTMLPETSVPGQLADPSLPDWVTGVREWKQVLCDKGK